MVGPNYSQRSEDYLRPNEPAKKHKRGRFGGLIVTLVIIIALVVTAAYVIRFRNSHHTFAADSRTPKSVENALSDYSSRIRQAILKPQEDAEAEAAVGAVTDDVSKLAILNATGLTENEYLKPQQATVNQVVASFTKKPSGYEVLTYQTSVVEYTPQEGTTITINGVKKDLLVTSTSQMHRLSMKAENGIGNLSVNKDEVVSPSAAPTATTMLATLPQEDGDAAKPASSSATSASGFNPGRAVEYAENWAQVGVESVDDAEVRGGRYPGEVLNQKYPYYGNDNCANFVSQALAAGGLKRANSLKLDVKNPDAWSDGLWLTLGVKATRTWTLANANFAYMLSKSGHYVQAGEADGKSMEQMAGLKPGSLIYAAWNGGENKDHVGLVVGQLSRGKKSQPIISQKGWNQYNMPLSAHRAHELQQHKNARWTALAVK